MDARFDHAFAVRRQPAVAVSIVGPGSTQYCYPSLSATSGLLFDLSRHHLSQLGLAVGHQEIIKLLVCASDTGILEAAAMPPLATNLC